MSQSGLNASQLLHELTAQAEKEGISLHELSQVIEDKAKASDEEGFELIPGGAMTDGAKRRLTAANENPPVDRVPTRPVKTSAPAAEAPSPRFPTGEVSSHRLPPGVPSFEKWGRCVINHGRYAKDGLSFEELATSTLKDHQSYVIWVRQHPRASNDPRYTDLVAYLTAFDELYGKSSSSEGFYPDSLIRRQFK